MMIDRLVGLENNAGVEGTKYLAHRVSRYPI